METTTDRFFRQLCDSLGFVCVAVDCDLRVRFWNRQAAVQFQRSSEEMLGRPAGWKFPDGTVLVETISLEMEKGNPRSSRRLETRILHHRRLAGGEDVGDQYWHGYTYLWNDRQTDAVLLEDPQGRDRTYYGQYELKFP